MLSTMTMKLDVSLSEPVFPCVVVNNMFPYFTGREDKHHGLSRSNDSVGRNVRVRWSLSILSPRSRMF